MKKIENLEDWRKMSEYVKETFLKAEGHAALLFSCAAWAVHAMMTLRKHAETGEDSEINPFPDLQMRTFEELGREMDRLCKDVNEKIPVIKKEKE